jgi:hypothetical protein
MKQLLHAEAAPVLTALDCQRPKLVGRDIYLAELNSQQLMCFAMAVQPSSDCPGVKAMA